MKPISPFARFLARPSHFVPCIVVAGVAVLPAFLAGGCGSSTSSSANNTDQFTSIETRNIVLDVAWPVYIAPAPTPTPTPTPTGATPTPTPTATPTPDPSATPPYTETDSLVTDAKLTAPASALSAVITLTTADPNSGSAIIYPAINRKTDSNNLTVEYSSHYVMERKARIGNTNANVRFYDARDGKGNPLGDYRAFGLQINDDGTGLNAGLTLVAPSATPTVSDSPSASPSASP